MLKKDENLWIFLGILILVALDQLSKSYFMGKEYFVGSLISIDYIRNYGSSFGIFSGVDFYPQIMFVISVIFLVILIMKRESFLGTRIGTLSFALVISGIIGNGVDRVIFSYVRDFISLKYLFIFNFADFYLSLGVALLLISALSEDKDLKNENKKK